MAASGHQDRGSSLPEALFRHGLVISSGGTLTLTNALHAVRERWWVLIAGLLIGLAAAAAASWTAVPVYTSTTRLFVGATGEAENADAYAGGLFAQQRVQSYVRVLEGDRLGRRVIADVGLQVTPDELAAKVTVRPVPETAILEVTVSDGSPERARAIADSFGRHAIEQVTVLETTAGAVDPAVRVTTLDAATLETEPVSPDVTRNVALGISLGLLAGLMAVLLPARFGRGIVTREQVRECTGRDVLGALVEDHRFRDVGPLAGLRADSPNREALRAVRGRLLHAHRDTPPRVLVVTSALRGEGSSVLAANLAVTVAQAGARTLLIDADVRNPSVSRYLDLPEDTGLTDVLSGRASLEDAVRPWGEDSLLVLTAGSVPLDPSALHDSLSLRALVDTLKDSYDVVIIDAPALAPVADAAVMAAWADGCILVTRYGGTPREHLSGAAAVLARERAELLGVVLNRVPPRSARARGYRHPYPADPDRRARRDLIDRRLHIGAPGRGAPRTANSAVAVSPTARPERP
ncbi:polysaccharide biosynthesis tyrosine autokinase [Blastococcus mobilis]|uniref:Capsular exopolysaccharide family n=1 Tax=Blastococcus mobilis TaxID=1938746 RepID=A0A238Z0Q8_9ACTN|nr:polysaccharide biosynthesis tyrosine autokinase [Blastococcus mobilis]SNR76970.1 capsular exopolysaccharide family [Blastococcus mobilis]